MSGRSTPALTPALLTPEDYFRLNFLSDPQISPDGSRVAYLRLRANVQTDRVDSEVCVLDRASGRVDELGAGGQPRWSPDGASLAFVRAAGEQAELALWHATDGAIASLARLDDAPQGLAWSPDGRRIAFVMHAPLAAAEPAPPSRPAPAWHALRNPQWAAAPRATDQLVQRVEGVDADLPEGQWQVFLIELASGQLRQVTFEDFDHGGPRVEITKLSLAGRISWAPDSRRFVMSMQRHAPAPGPVDPDSVINTEVYEFDTADGSVRQLTHFGGAICRATVSPDGRWIAFVGFRNERRSFHTNLVHVMPREGGEPRALPHPLGLEIHQDIQWLPDSTGVLALYPHEGDGCLARVDLAGQWTLLSREMGGGGGSGYVLYSKHFSVSRTGEIGYLRGSTRQTDEVAVLSADGQRSETLTSEGAWLAQRAVAPVEAVWLDTQPQPMQAWMLRPPGVPADEPLPLVVWLHGGPYLAWCGQFAVLPQLWAARGYAVLMMNPRGSLGYGEDYTRALHHDFPGAGDLVIRDAVDLAVARGGIDPARVFLAGESAGGVLTSWLVGHTDRFKAAAVVYGVMDWTSCVLTQDRVDYYPFYWLAEPPWAPGMHEHYWARSPVSRVGHVTTPTMVLCGERDWRTPFSQSELYYSALKLCGVKTELVRFPDNNHGLERHPSHYMELMEQVDGWFKRHDTVVA